MEIFLGCVSASEMELSFGNGNTAGSVELGSPSDNKGVFGGLESPLPAGNSARRFSGIGSFLRQRVQLQVWSLPWTAQHGALDKDLRTLPTTGVVPLTYLQSRNLSSAN